MNRRLRQNGIVVFFSLIVFLSVWQIITGPGPPYAPPYRKHEWDPIGSNESYSYPMATLNDTDYQQLIDINNFTFTMLSLACNETYPFLLIMVHSAPWNVEKRAVIRETWGGKGNDGVKLLFMLGQVKTHYWRSKLDEENDKYKDFVQGTFLDSYRNVTYKHDMVFKYTVYHCPAAKYVLKADDDVFVNVGQLVTFLKSNVSAYGATNLVMCYVMKNAKASRSFRSKWRVSFAEYPERFYPEYCPGWAIVYSNNALFKLYKELQARRPYFWIDDVLITGLLATKIGIPLTNIRPLTLGSDGYYKLTNSRTKIDFVFMGGELDPDIIRFLYSYVNKNDTNHT